ncbi:MAG TPA: hypothetical protein VN947_07795 [Polyangia bacterium]|nr:hypothetical protein [Polyangia bacterium]
MKTKMIRRSLSWGVLFAGFAGTLTVATRPVRAESITSSALAGAVGDGATVQPYFWSEIAHAATDVAHAVTTALISGNIGLDVKGDGWAPVYIAAAGVNQPSAISSLSARSLD